ncbi:major facilitator superfamily domain-containing protein [Mrakia frigida]|uniref:major facilitator superfamily domain-containing protein n=1 Tax=Mrakia frigida TaxID=29902 RepID=UPI003FCBF81B
MSGVTYGNNVPPDYDIESKQNATPFDEEKGVNSSDGNELNYDDASSGASVINAGTAKVEAAQQVWGKTSRAFLFLGLGLAVYVYSLDGVTTWQYLFYATSAVGAHALSGTVTTAGAIIIAVGKPFMAKLADTIGRAETYIVVTICYIIGYCLLGGAQTIGMIAGGKIMYSLGYTGLQLLTSIVIADMTTLRWRGLVVAFVSMPYVLNSFVSGEIVTAFIPGRWRIGYFMFAILVPVCVLPIVFTLLWAQRQAKKLELLKPTKLEEAIKTKPLQSIKVFFAEMDAIGLILVAASLSLLLLPLGLTNRTGSLDGWKEPGNIVMIILGFALFPCFVWWEIKYASVPLMPLRFLKNPSITASLAISFIDFVSFYVVYVYQYSFFAISKTGVWTVREQSYFQNTMTIALCVFSIPTGYVMYKTRRYKNMLVFGLLLRLLGVGVMIRSRGSDGGAFELVMCQLMQGAGGAIAAVTTGIASQAGVTHADVGTVTALVLLFAEIGYSFGSTISAAIWTNTYRSALAVHLPTLNSSAIDLLYSTPTSVAVLAIDDPIRVGTIAAVSSVMKTLCIVATVVAIFPPIIAWFWMEDYELGDVQNVYDGRDLLGNKVQEGTGDKEAEQARAARV